jgi:hypothetical protein
MGDATEKMVRLIANNSFEKVKLLGTAIAKSVVDNDITDVEAVVILLSSAIVHGKKAGMTLEDAVNGLRVGWTRETSQTQEK